MITFPSVSGLVLIRALCKFEFEVVHSRGCHLFLRHADGRRTIVPVHRGETIGRGLLAQILRDCEISRKDLQDVL